MERPEVVSSSRHPVTHMNELLLVMLVLRYAVPSTDTVVASFPNTFFVPESKERDLFQVSVLNNPRYL